MPCVVIVQSVYIKNYIDARESEKTTAAVVICTHRPATVKKPTVQMNQGLSYGRPKAESVTAYGTVTNDNDSASAEEVGI